MVGRYLEHARIFIFANGGDAEYYISSADLMTRNIDHRFEVICPVYDPKVKKEIMDLIEIQWNDNVKSRSLDWGNINNYIRSDRPEVNTHDVTYEYFKKFR